MTEKKKLPTDAELLEQNKDIELQVAKLNSRLAADIENSLRHVRWTLHVYKIRAWLKKKKYVPAIVRKYVLKNWDFNGPKGPIFLFKREIIDNEKDRKKIFDAAEESYGGHFANNALSSTPVPWHKPRRCSKAPSWRGTATVEGRAPQTVETKDLYCDRQTRADSG